jgi:hypothetical protein
MAEPAAADGTARRSRPTGYTAWSPRAGTRDIARPLAFRTNIANRARAYRLDGQPGGGA